MNSTINGITNNQYRIMTIIRILIANADTDTTSIANTYEYEHYY